MSLPWEAARSLAARAAEPVEPVVLPLAAAAGTVLAAAARARSDLPVADVSAMDGWAVAGPPPWRVIGEVLAGGPSMPVSPGQAVRIATGAVLPNGATSVLRREHGDGANPLRPLGSAPVNGADVRLAGQESRRGDVVLAAAGLDQVEVRRVRADVLVLGDELLTSGPARGGRLRDALGPLLSAWLPARGVEVASRRHVPDTAAALRMALGACTSDLVVSTGSTARGPVDHLHAVLAECGARLVVDGVAVRPGHPQLLAVLPDGRVWVGLPGNPLAAVSGLLTLLDPLARRLRGLEDAARGSGRLAVDVAAGGEATRLLPVRDGRPVMFAGPAMLRGLATAHAVAVIPPGGASAGTDVELLSLP